MYQTDNIKDLASELGIDYGTSSNSADQLRKIAQQVGLDNYNSLYDNDKLEEKLKNLRREKNPDMQHVDARNNTASLNNPNIQNKNNIRNNQNLGSNALKRRLNNPNANNRMINNLASKGAQAVGVPKSIADKAVNSKLGQKAISNIKKKNLALNILDKIAGGGKKQVEEQASDGGGENFKISYNFVKYAAIALLGSLIPFMLLAMIIPSSMLYLNVVKLGHADSISCDKADEKINKKKDKDGVIDEENIGSEAINYDSESDSLYAYVDIYNTNSSKFKSLKLATNKTTYLKRKYNEADLETLEEFYPEIGELGKDNDKNLVYDFFFKMYNIYITYRDDYNVYIDLPLLMSTLNMQSDDMSVVFSSNLTSEDRKSVARKLPIAEYAYDYSWSDYKLSSTNSEHDMEILAQHMVSKQSREYCQDSSGTITKENILKDSEIGIQTLQCSEGETYQTEDLGYQIDLDKYDEFLKQFLERKYFLDEDTTIEEDNDIDVSENTAAVGSFRQWTQCGQSWSNKKIGSGTMCKIGCLVTSISIQIARSGTTITTDSINPGIAAKKFKFDGNGNLYWASVNNLAPYFKRKTEFSAVGMSRVSLANKILSYDSNKYYFILNVGKIGREKAHHYVALDYVDNDGNIYIMDPASTSITSLYDYYKVYKVVVYEKED